MNLAGVVPWTYWRGARRARRCSSPATSSASACPFMLPRDLARRLRPPRRAWPRALRTKWLAVALLVALPLGLRRSFALWDDPARDGLAARRLLRGRARRRRASSAARASASTSARSASSSSCTSLASPLEVAVREPDVCATCTTHDCLRGNASAPRLRARAVPARRRSGNLDCTFCLDCVRACPHDNVGILAAAARARARRRSRRARRSAGSRSGPTSRRSRSCSCSAPSRAPPRWSLPSRSGTRSRSLASATTAAFALALGVAPLALAGLASGSGRRFALALVPLGLAHVGRALRLPPLAGWRSIVPVLQRLAPSWLGPRRAGRCRRGSSADRLLGLELLLLDLGLLVTLVGRLARRERLSSRAPRGRSRSPRRGPLSPSRSGSPGSGSSSSRCRCAGS